MIRRLLRRIPLKGWYEEAHKVWRLWRSANYRFIDFYQPGHYYSPIPDLDEVVAGGELLFDRSMRDIPAIDLNARSQVELTGHLSCYYHELPFSVAPDGERRFYLANSYFQLRGWHRAVLISPPLQTEADNRSRVGVFLCRDVRCQ